MVCVCEAPWWYELDQTTVKNMGDWMKYNSYICLKHEVCQNGHFNSIGSQSLYGQCITCLPQEQLISMLKSNPSTRCNEWGCTNGFSGPQNIPCSRCNIGQPIIAHGLNPEHYIWSYLFTVEGKSDLKRHASDNDRKNIIAIRGSL